jgi:hypothetical protein
MMTNDELNELREQAKKSHKIVYIRYKNGKKEYCYGTIRIFYWLNSDYRYSYIEETTDFDKFLESLYALDKRQLDKTDKITIIQESKLLEKSRTLMDVADYLSVMCVVNMPGTDCLYFKINNERNNLFSSPDSVIFCTHEDFIAKVQEIIDKKGDKA